jgi:hypothetical protein
MGHTGMVAAGRRRHHLPSGKIPVAAVHLKTTISMWLNSAPEPFFQRFLLMGDRAGKQGLALHCRNFGFRRPFHFIFRFGTPSSYLAVIADNLHELSICCFVGTAVAVKTAIGRQALTKVFPIGRNNASKW